MAETSRPAKQSNVVGARRLKSILIHLSAMPTCLCDSPIQNKQHKPSASVSVSQNPTPQWPSKYRLISCCATLPIRHCFPEVHGPCTAVGYQGHPSREIVWKSKHRRQFFLAGVVERREEFLGCNGGGTLQSHVEFQQEVMFLAMKPWEQVSPELACKYSRKPDESQKRTQ